MTISAAPRKVLTLMALFICLYSVPQGRSESTKDLYEAGMRAMDKGDFTAALENFEKARDQNPEIAQLHNAVGIAHLQKQDDADAAVEAFQEAIRLDPKLADAQNNLGIIYTGLLEDYDLAEEYFKEALKIYPEFSRAYFGLGWLYLTKKRQPEKAVEYLEKAVQTNPDYAEAYYYLGVAYIITDHKPEALTPITILKAKGKDDFARTLETMMEEDSKIVRRKMLGEEPQEEVSPSTADASGPASRVQL